MNLAMAFIVYLLYLDQSQTWNLDRAKTPAGPNSKFVTDRGITTTPLTLGTGSPIYKITSEKGVFIDRGFDPLLTLDEIHDELEITLWASNHNIAPHVYEYNISHIVMEWVDGKHIQELSWDQIRQLAETFKKMHSMPPPENIRLPQKCHFADTFLDVFSQIEQKTTIPLYLEKIKAKLLRETFSDPLVLCHEDVHANNVLWTRERLFFIDWTCAGLDYPLVDLAVVSMFWNLTQTQENYMLKCYFGEDPNETQMTRLGIFKNYAKIKWAMWPIMHVLVNYPEKISVLGSILEKNFKMPTHRTFEEYRTALFTGKFTTLVQTFDDWIDLHLARIQATDLTSFLIE
jgi:thiamine kinase-like enzyme